MYSIWFCRYLWIIHVPEGNTMSSVKDKKPGRLSALQRFVCVVRLWWTYLISVFHYVIPAQIKIETTSTETITDIQNYLDNFNKEIQTGDGTTIQPLSGIGCMTTSNDVHALSTDNSVSSSAWSFFSVHPVFKHPLYRFVASQMFRQLLLTTMVPLMVPTLWMKMANTTSSPIPMKILSLYLVSQEALLLID